MEYRSITRRPVSGRVLSVVLLLLAVSFANFAAAQTKPVDAQGHQWWQHAVFYEIYPRSFADSNNDGVGDLNGITSKMGYLHELGVDAIWITPCYPSPQVDFGYDVSNYEDIDPMYGTLANFDHMVAQGKKDGVRIIMDFVPNHTSDQHPWFLDSKSSRTAAHRDWYIWRDGKAPGQPPNNWISIFGGSAWKFDPGTNQYYYHFFYAAQPDLNWRNPAVEKAMLDTTHWWYQRGVAGFALDAVDTLLEDPELRNNSLLPGVRPFCSEPGRNSATTPPSAPHLIKNGVFYPRKPLNLTKSTRLSRRLKRWGDRKSSPVARRYSRRILSLIQQTSFPQNLNARAPMTHSLAVPDLRKFVESRQTCTKTHFSDVFRRRKIFINPIFCQAILLSKFAFLRHQEVSQISPFIRPFWPEPGRVEVEISFKTSLGHFFGIFMRKFFLNFLTPPPPPPPTTTTTTTSFDQKRRFLPEKTTKFDKINAFKSKT